MEKIIECVPNFSEGRNKEVIKQITDEVERVKGVKLLDVDPGEATNRTVVTFVGEPQQVVEAAFRCVKKAAQLIDAPAPWCPPSYGRYRRMSAHPRGRNHARRMRAAGPSVGRTHCCRAESALLLL